MSQKFRIGFDLSALDPEFRAHAWRGTGRYVANIWKYLQRNLSDEVVLEPFSYRDLAVCKPAVAACDLLPAGRQTAKTQLVYPWAFGKLPFDALYFSSHFDAPSWCRIPRIVTVLDLIPILFTHLFGARAQTKRFKFGRYLENLALQNASWVLAISENTAADCQRVLGFDPARITVTPLGVDEVFYASPQVSRAELHARIPRLAGAEYVLSVGGIDPRKNWRTLLRAFRNLVDRCRTNRRPLPLLVLVGKIQSDDQYQPMHDLARELGIESLIVETGFVEDSVLVRLYADAVALLFPSMYEGFGLTPLEAMSVGCPVVCSDTSSIPEVVGDAGLLRDPFDAVGFGRDLYTLLEEPTVAQGLVEHGKKMSQRFTWERTGELTLQGFEQAARYLRRQQ